MSFRVGDVVQHRPSGETWVLACDEKLGKALPAGWPQSLADAADCTLIHAADDAERDSMLSGHILLVSR